MNSVIDWGVTFEAFPDLALLVDEHKRILWINTMACETLGCSLDEAIGQSAREVLPGLDGPDRVEVSAPQAREVRRQFVKAPRLGKVLDVTTCPLHDGHEQIVGTLYLARDVTESQRAEEALQGSEKRYRELVGAIQEGLGLVDEREVIQFCNPAFARIFEVPSTDLVGRNLRDFVDAKSWQELLRQTAVRRTGKDSVYELTVWTPRGNLRHVMVHGSPRFDAAGKYLGTFGLVQDITERKQAEEALKASEAKYHDLWQSAPVAYFSIGTDGSIERANKAAETLTGYRLEELQTMKVLHLYAEESKEKAKRLFERFERGIPWQNEELIYERKDGQKVYGLLCVNPVKDANGQVLESRSAVVDITQRRQAERALHKRTRDLGERVKELNCLYAISKVVEKPDISLDEIVQGIVDLIPPACQYPGITCTRITLQGKEFQTKNFRETIWKQTSDIKVHGKRLGSLEVFYLEEKPESDEGPFLREERKLINAIAERLGETIEHKWAEEALQESEEKYRNVVEHSNDGICILQDTLLKYANRELARIMGYCVEEIVGKPFGNYVHSDELQRVKESYERHVAGKEDEQRYEAALNHKDGHRVDVEFNVSVTNYDGRRAALAFIRDITEHKRAREQLFQAKTMESIGTLAGGIAHDFNNLMVGVLGSAALLRDRLGPDHPTASLLATIEESATHAGDLARQLLTYARAGESHPQLIDLNETVRNVLNLQETILSPLVTTEYDLDLDLAGIEVDPVQIQQLLVALCTNAAEAMLNGGRIRLTTRNTEVDPASARSCPGLKPGPYVSLRVEDNGCGMNEETLARLFEPFFTTKSLGRGLGLAVVYGIVKNHKGWVTAESEVGRGTAVVVLLPAKRRPTPPEPEPTLAVRRGSETMLLIDDEAVVLDITKQLLEKLGYRVLIAHNGQEAMQVTENYEGDIDLALLDLAMPTMDGYQAFPLLRKQRPDMKILICSGYAPDGPAEDLIRAGAVTFLQKPFGLDALSEAIRTALDGKSAPS